MPAVGFHARLRPGSGRMGARRTGHRRANMQGVARNFFHLAIAYGISGMISGIIDVYKP